MTVLPWTVLSLALDSLERATWDNPCILAAMMLENATRAENGVCPFKYPCRFSSSMLGSRVRLAFKTWPSFSPAASVVWMVAPLGLMM